MFSPWLLVRWTFTALRGAYEGLVSNTIGLTVPAALVLLAGMVAGLAVVISERRRVDVQRRLAAPVALAMAGIGFLVFSGVGRGIMGVQGALGGRYLYMAATFTAPLLAAL